MSHTMLAFSSSSLSWTTGSCSQIWNSVDIISTQHFHFFMQKDQATIVTLVRGKIITVSGQMALIQPHRSIHVYSLYRSLDPRTRNFGLISYGSNRAIESKPRAVCIYSKKDASVWYTATKKNSLSQRGIIQKI